MPIVLNKHTSNGREFDITETGQKIYKSFIGQKNVDLGGDNFAPYVWDEQDQSIRYSNKVCEFYSAGHQTLREYGSAETLIEEQNIVLEYWRTQGGGSWRIIDLYQIGLTVDQQDEQCVVTRILSDGDIEQPTTNILRVEFLFRPQEKVKNTFRLHVVDTELTYRIRFQNTGIAGEVVEIPLTNVKTQTNYGIYKLRFDIIEFRWDKDEIDLHSYIIESQAGGKKLDIFISDFILDANGDVVISPDQWGETGIAHTNDDCCEGESSGVFLSGIDVDGDLCGHADWEGPSQAWEYYARFQNVIIAANPISVDAGTQIEYDVGYSSESFTPVVYGLEGDTPDFNTAAGSTRPRTTASHSFASPSTGADKVIDGANFQAIIKEILDTSWSSGFDLGLVFDDGNASGFDQGFQVEDVDTGPPSRDPARITIVYTPVSGETFYQNAGQGAVAPTGTLTKAATFVKAIGGHSMSITGILSKKTSKFIGEHSMSIAGTLNKKTTLITAMGGHNMSIAGTLTKAVVFTQNTGGHAMTITGVLTTIVTFVRTIGGHAMTIVGTLAKKTSIGVGAGQTVSTGILNKKTSKNVGGGSVTSIGTLATAVMFTQAIGGASMSIVGSFATQFIAGVGNGVTKFIRRRKTFYKQ